MPRVALATAVAVALVLVVVIVDRQGGEKSSGSGEVFLQSASAAGPDPFTPSVAGRGEPAVSPTSPAPDATDSGEATGTTVARSVRGSVPGLYGGSRKVSSCEVDKLSDYLSSHKDKAGAWAGVLDIDAADIPEYLRSLTSVLVRNDTRVTNHGFSDGKATAFQSVLQSGTAVLVDTRGVPRVRCACGNPLTDPVEVRGTMLLKGKPWPGYRQSNVIVVKPAPEPVGAMMLVDPRSGTWFHRPVGTEGERDKTVPPPKDSPSTGPGSKSPAPSTSESDESPASPPPSSEPPPSEPPPPGPSTDTGSTTPDENTPDDTTTDGKTPEDVPPDAPPDAPPDGATSSDAVDPGVPQESPPAPAPAASP